MNLSRKIINLAKNLNESLGDESTPEGSWKNLLWMADAEGWLREEYEDRLPKMPKAYIEIYNQIHNSDIPRIYEKETGEEFEEIGDLIFGAEISVLDNKPVMKRLNKLLDKYCYEG